MFLKGYHLEANTPPKNWNQSVHIYWARLASLKSMEMVSYVQGQLTR